MRFRTVLIVLVPLLVVAGLLLTDPDKGLTTGMFLMALNVGFLAVDATQRIAQLRVDDTSQWPDGEVETDIVLTSPEGDTVGTDRARFTVEYGVT